MFKLNSSKTCFLVHLNRGGVMTAGSVFWDSDLIERLEKRNIKFVTVSEKA